MFVARIHDSRPTGAADPTAASLGASVEAHLRSYFQLHGDGLPPNGLYERVLKEVELPLIALTLSPLVWRIGA